MKTKLRTVDPGDDGPVELRVGVLEGTCHIDVVPYGTRSAFIAHRIAPVGTFSAAVTIANAIALAVRGS